MVFAQGALGIVLLGFLLFCLLDVITTDGSQVRHLPKVAWIILVVLINPIGGIAWLFAGRPRAGDQPTGARPRPNRPTGRGSLGSPRPSAPMAPDDDPEFLAELRRREEELRRKQRGEDDSVS